MRAINAGRIAFVRSTSDIELKSVFVIYGRWGAAQEEEDIFRMPPTPAHVVGAA